MKRRKKCVIDAAAFSDRASVAAAFRAALQTEDLIGNSADALYDVLTALTEPTELILTGIHTARRTLGDRLDPYLAAMTDAASVCPLLRVTFCCAKSFKEKNN